MRGRGSKRFKPFVKFLLERLQRLPVLATGYLKLRGNTGQAAYVRTIFDTGAEINVISDYVVKALNITRQQTTIQIRGVTGDEQPAIGAVNIQISPWFDENIKLFKTFIILKQVPLSQKARFPDESEEFRSLVKADPEYNLPGKVEMLLGIDTWAEIIQRGIVRSSIGLCAQRTILGHVIFGSIVDNQSASQSKNHANTALSCVTQEQSEQLDQLLEKFWVIEEQNEPCVSQEDARAEEWFSKTVKRSKSGRYIVRLPLVEHNALLGESKAIALQRFYQIERRLSRDPELRVKYNDFMREYLELNHMRLATKAEKRADGYYIPHHAVIKRFRVVFDASCVTTNGKSANDIQLTGPNLQEELPIIITRFRTHRLVMIADIKKMFRQIDIAAEDTKYQKILWRFETTEPLKEYVLTTVTYGMKSSPFLAIRTMIQLADDYEHKYPRAAAATRLERYMDDYMTGADDEEQLIVLYRQLNEMLREGQLELSKWKTNSSKLARRITVDTSDHVIELNDTSTSVLGLKWLPSSDCFTFSVESKWVDHIDHKKATKRSVLAAIARIYDPCGFLAPVIILAKSFMQELWKRKLDWDADLNDNHKELVNRWKKYYDGLQALNELKIPRWFHTSDSSTLTLYGFADASEMGYGAVLYVRCTNGADVTMSLLTSKTRVAPLKPLTIPRMELCAAVLLAKLKEKVQKHCSFLNVPCVLHSDSMVALSWIKTNPSLLKQFVAKRVVTINELTNHSEWYYVRSKQNPADLCSRGMQASDLVSSELWWKGPQYLWDPKTNAESIDQSPSTCETEAITAEHRKLISCALTREETSWFSKGDTPLIDLYSSHGKLIRITAFVLKATKIFKGTYRAVDPINTSRTARAAEPTIVGHLTPQLLNEADLYWVRFTQLRHYGKELRALEQKQPLKNTSVLLRISPMLDGENIIRVYGRVSNAELTYDEKHPIIIPSDSTYGQMLLREAHAKTHHGGVQQILHSIRTRYWLTSARRAARAVAKSCNICRRYRNHPIKQFMSSLPKERVMAARPFAYCGIDYFGPIKVKRHQAKKVVMDLGYAAVFICLVTRMTHIECVSDLTTDRFLWALQRLASIYQMPLKMFSDNAKTFKGAANELRRIHETWRAVDVASHLNKSGTKWQFITPRAPFQGGIWEAAVKSVKHHMNRTLRDRKMTFEQYQTLFAKISAVLNSRPIAPLVDDPHELNYLTPSHAVIGERAVQPFSYDLTEIPESRLKQQLLLDKIQQEFWIAFRKDYLSSLQSRYKWNSKEQNLKVGELVLIKEDNTPPGVWPMGRVIEVYPGSDGLVRNVRLRTHGAELSRPVQKLIKLNIDEKTI